MSTKLSDLAVLIDAVFVGDGIEKRPATVADLVAALIAERVLHRQHREVVGQNDDGSLNGQDYTEFRWVTEWTVQSPEGSA